MTLPATTRGLRDLAQLRNRIARDYGQGKISWPDFEYLNEHLNAVQDRLIELAANDPRRIALEAQKDDVA